MSWLVGQLWPWMLVSMALGSVLTTLLATRREKVERWVLDEPADPAAQQVDVVDVIAAATTVPVAAPALRAASTSPFPEFRGEAAGPRPWEEEELWSRPVRRAATHAKGPTADEKWDDAADNWRTWAEAATGQAAERGAALAAVAGPLSDEELFAQARSETHLDDADRDDDTDDDIDHPGARTGGPIDDYDDFPHDEPVDVPVRTAEVRLLPPYGPGSAHPTYDGSPPPGFPVKGHEASRLFHTPGSRYFSRTAPDVWFESEAAAEAAGFLRWDRRSPDAYDGPGGVLPGARAAAG
jgi:hypothetical protein